MAAWRRTLTPEAIRRENAFRTTQRRAGKLRPGNIKDPDAPKKPLPASLMFLQHIRGDPDRMKEVFGDEKETTVQSALAAKAWREITEEERNVGSTSLVQFCHHFLSISGRLLILTSCV